MPHLAAAREVEGFLPRSAGAKLAWIAPRPELENAVGAKGVAARSGKQRPVSCLARVPVGEVAELGLPIDRVILVTGFAVQDGLNGNAVVIGLNDLVVGAVQF